MSNWAVASCHLVTDMELLSPDFEPNSADKCEEECADDDFEDDFEGEAD